MRMWESTRVTGRCGRCRFPVSSVQERAAGYHEACADENDWPYPTEAEARRLLGESEEDS